MPAAKSKSKRPKGQPKKSAARTRAAQGVSLSGALAEAAWSEADAALARALADCDEALSATAKAAREDALSRLALSLSHAARKRGLTRVGEVGSQELYDPSTHVLNTPVAKPPKTVRIQARGVVRGGEMLEKPRVAPLERKRR